MALHTKFLKMIESKYTKVYQMVKTTVKVDKELVKEAHELGLNVSKVCENALKRAIKQMKKVYGKNNCEWCGRRDLNPGPQRGRLH